jgi:hypothetical protein
MPAVAVMAITAAASAYSANRQASAARSAQRSADRASQGQEDIQREQLADARQQRADWERRFGPAFDQMGQMAFAEVRPDFEAVEADIGGAFDTSREINARNQMRMGVRPTDGAAADDERQYGIGRALGIAGGRNAARMVARDEGFNRLTRYVDAGNGIRASADNMAGAAYAGIANAFGQRAGMQNGNAAQFRQQSAASWGQAFSALGYMSGGMGGGTNFGAQTGQMLNANSFYNGGSPLGPNGGMSNGYYNPPQWGGGG